MQNINLYDASLRQARDLLTLETAAAAVGGTLLAVALAAGWARAQTGPLEVPVADTNSALQAQQATMQTLATQLADLKPDTKLQGDLSLAQTTLEQRRNALQLLSSGALGDPQGHAAALEALSRQAVDGLWLTGVTLASHDMALRGRALDPSLVPAYVSRLNREAALRGRAFRALDMSRPDADALPAVAASAARTGAPLMPARLAGHVEFLLSGAATTLASGKPSAEQP